MRNPHTAQGVGMNLRLSFLDAIAAHDPEVAFWEVIAENLFDNPAAVATLQGIPRPISLHCVGMNLAGTDPLSGEYLDKIGALIEALDPILVSDHLCWQRHGGVSHHDLLPFPLTPETAEHVARRIDAVQDTLGRQIAVENLAYYAEFRASTHSEDALLNQIATETGCGLILDLNNIEVNEHNLGHDKARYLSGLSLEHVVEIHVAGPERVGDALIDTHGSLPTPFQARPSPNTPSCALSRSATSATTTSPARRQPRRCPRAGSTQSGGARSHAENHARPLQRCSKRRSGRPRRSLDAPDRRRAVDLPLRGF